MTNSTITLDGSNRGTYTYSGVSTYQGRWMRFYIEADSDQFGINGTATDKNYVTNGSNFSLAKGRKGTDGYYGYYKVGANATSVTFTFQLNSNDGTIQVSETSSSTGWYLIGGNNNEWGAWNTSAKSTELLSNGTEHEYSITVTVTGKTYFRVHDGGTEYNLSSSSDTAITSTYQDLVANNKKAMYLNSAGTYTITVYHNDSTKRIKAVQIAMSTLTVADTANAAVTATYNGLTASEGAANKLSDIPQDATITVNVAADQGYEIASAVYYPDNDSTDTTNLTFTANRATFTMPAANTTIEVTMRQMTGMRQVYFNNYKSKYSKVFAYAYDKQGDVITRTPLGPRPGTAMTKLDNTNTWVIEVPYGIQNIIFTGDDGYNTANAHEAIPWSDYPSGKSPMYYPASTDKTNPAGDWKEYVPRTNEYEVTAGGTMDDYDYLYSGINATFYDYLYDSEINGKWLTSITGDDASGSEHDPYKILNKGLSDYAKNHTVNGTADAVTYPLYFGILLADDGGTDYYKFIKKVNNASGLGSGHENDALTGLTGQLQDGDGIHYYKSGATNENGAPMALFDEDFLSGENTAGSDDSSKVLAKILRSHAFPVRKEENVGVTSDTVWLDVAAKWGGTEYHEYIYAWVWGEGKTSKWVKFSKDSDKGLFYASGVTGYTGMKVMSCTNEDITDGDEVYGTPSISYGNNVTGDIPILVQEKAYCKLTSYNTGEFTTGEQDTVTLVGGHTYYEYNSTDGKDNAFITNINTSDHTAQINYYPDSGQYAQYSTNKGFFPFDYNNIIAGNGDGGTNGYKDNQYAYDQGFGVKLEIPFTVNNGGLNDDGTAQTFDFSGDDDLWVFIDDHLVLDLGGAHARTTGSINFNTMTATADNSQSVANGITRNGEFGSGWFDNTKTTVPHKMTIYYMERGMQNSNLKFGFSFNAIPNQLKVEKKIRTNTVNSGFYKVIANQTAAVDGNNKPILNDKGKPITWFENSYQTDDFIITQQYQNIATDPATGLPLNHVSYTLKDTHYDATPTDNKFDYESVTNDDVCYTLGQFPAEQYIKLWEHLDKNHANIYKYTPSVSLYDDAVNTKTKLVTDALNNPAVTGSNADEEGFRFLFQETKPISGFDNLNMRAQVENDMVNHTLTLRKVTDVTDTTSTFPITIKWKFATQQPEGAYIAYPLYCTVDGIDRQFDDNGTITIKSGETVVIPGIPENAEMQIVEGTPTGSSYTYRYGGTAVTDGSGTPITANVANITKGITYKMGATDTVVTVNNKQKKPYVDMTFTYPSYLKRNNSEFQDDRYHISNRRLMDYEVENYFNINDDGSISFKETAGGVNYKANFINYIAPYEDNFMQTILWDAAGAVITYNATTDTLEGTVNSTTQDRNLNISLILPYDHSGDTGTNTAFTASGNTYQEKPVETPIVNTTTKCFQWLSFNEYKTKDADPDGSRAAFLKAPLVLNSGSDHYYFDYWSVTNTTSGTNDYIKEYTRCYYYKFNLTLFQDSIIQAVYHKAADGEVAPTIEKAEEIAQAAQHASTDGVQITFIENSRNQYNMANSSHTSEKRRISGDRIYTDFLLSFNNATGDNQVLNEYARGTYTCGIVIEKAGVVDQSGVTQNETGYQAAYGADVSSSHGMNETQIKTYITSNGKTKPDGTVAILSKFDAKDLDNKNRIEYFYSLANKQDGSLKELGNKDLVYRAYAFIAEGTGNNLSNVKISTVPVYYTIKQISEYQY